MAFLKGTTVKCIIASMIAAVLSAPDSAYALLTDDKTLFEGAKLCTSYLPRHEREYGIPVHLLAAIASTESGRYNKELGLNLPWPWTINVEGKGYFFDTKEEAVAKVKELQARGYQSIDVGCMQVNLYHHPNAFASLDQAFDPAYNIAYAAQFLKQNFNDEGSWRKATADYHSRTPYFGEQYARLVFSAWSRIINKVADAQSGNTILKANVSAVQPIDLSGNWPNNKKTYRHSYHALHMHSIAVGHETTRENGVLVIRPEHETVASLSSDPEEKFVINHTRYAQKKDGFEPEKHASKNPIVKPGDDKNAEAKGQFNPSIIHVNDTMPDKAGAKQNNVFVFDN